MYVSSQEGKSASFLSLHAPNLVMGLDCIISHKDKK